MENPEQSGFKGNCQWQAMNQYSKTLLAYVAIFKPIQLLYPSPCYIMRTVELEHEMKITGQWTYRFRIN